MEKTLLKQILLDQKHALQNYQIEPRAYSTDPQLKVPALGRSARNGARDAEKAVSEQRLSEDLPQ